MSHLQEYRPVSQSVRQAATVARLVANYIITPPKRRGRAFSTSLRSMVMRVDYMVMQGTSDRRLFRFEWPTAVGDLPVPPVNPLKLPTRQ
eukprot:8650472-Pyramimonas_sp.AAC.1